MNIGIATCPKYNKIRFLCKKFNSVREFVLVSLFFFNYP